MSEARQRQRQCAGHVAQPARLRKRHRLGRHHQDSSRAHGHLAFSGTVYNSGWRPATCDWRLAACDLRLAVCGWRPATCDWRLSRVIRPQAERRKPQAGDQPRHVPRQRSGELDPPARGRVHEAEPRGVQRLSREWRLPRIVARPAEAVLPLAHQRVSPRPGLHPDLVALPGPQRHLDQRLPLEPLEHAVPRLGILRPGLFEVRALLDRAAPCPTRACRARCPTRARGWPLTTAR